MGNMLTCGWQCLIGHSPRLSGLLVLSWWCILDWFKSYRCDHLKCVKIGSFIPRAKKLLFGVPQGSVLGPRLFSLCTTPVSKVIPNYPGFA